MSRKSVVDKKLRRKNNQEKEIKKDNISFDVINLLKDEKLETKPEVGEFLKKYVKSIRVLVEHQKVTLYPVMGYDISKVFVDFLDGHKIIAILNRTPREYYLYNGVDEIEINDKEQKCIIAFMQKLQEFSFVHN